MPSYNVCIFTKMFIIWAFVKGISWNKSSWNCQMFPLYFDSMSLLLPIEANAVYWSAELIDRLFVFLERNDLVRTASLRFFLIRFSWMISGRGRRYGKVWHIVTVWPLSVSFESIAFLINCHCTFTTTTTTTTVLRPFVQDYPFELVPEETFTHPPSWSSSNLYQLLPSTTIYGIFPVQITCLASFLYNLSPRPLVYLAAFL